MTFRIGLIGAGVMGAAHARTFTERVPGARVTQVFDFDESRAGEVVAFTGAAIAESATALIEAQDVDGVVIASPDRAHPELAMACVEAGKPRQGYPSEPTRLA